MIKTTKYCLSVLFTLMLTSTMTSAEEQQSASKQKQWSLQQGKLIWADLYTGDVQASLDFYTNTFGWTVQKYGNQNKNYHLLYDGEEAVAGVLSRSAQRKKTEEALWIGSIATNNVQASATAATTNNATLLLAPHDFFLYGKRSVIADPQGGVIAFLDISNSIKAKQSISRKWNWAQLFSIDTKKSADFYQKVFNFTIDEVEHNPSSYYLSQQGEVRASIVKLPASFEQRDRWVHFLEVENLSEIIAKAIQNGAQIIYQPEGLYLAIIADPNGALLGLTEKESE